MADEVSKTTARVNGPWAAALAWIKVDPQSQIFPIKERCKNPPLVTLDKAGNNPAKIKRFAQRRPFANWGLALARSNILVVDVDTKPGKHGQNTFDVLHMLNTFPDTMKVWTPSKGFHLYYHGEHRFALGKRGLGEDIDCPNYTLLPGSETAAGAYVPANDLPIAPAPDWIYEMLGERHAAELPASRNAVAAIELDQPHNIQWCRDYINEDAPPAIEGQNGDMTTLHVAMVLRDRGLSQDTCFGLMDELYNVDDKCIPIWTFEDLQRKVRNAYEYGKNAPGAGTAEADFGVPYIGTIPAYVRPTKAQQRQRRGRGRQNKLAKQAATPFKRATR
jgi:hypothetical protein